MEVLNRLSFEIHCRKVLLVKFSEDVEEEAENQKAVSRINYQFVYLQDF